MAARARPGKTRAFTIGFDVAEYLTHQPRPAFAPAKYDYAKGGKPKDARN